MISNTTKEWMGLLIIQCGHAKSIILVMLSQDCFWKLFSRQGKGANRRGTEWNDLTGDSPGDV